MWIDVAQMHGGSAEFQVGFEKEWLRFRVRFVAASCVSAVDNERDPLAVPGHFERRHSLYET